MGIEFDSANKLIKMTSPTVVISALSMYSSAMNWCSNIQNIGYTVPMKAVGKFPLGGNINSDSIFILINNWKVKWYNGNYTAVITGTLITDDGTSRTVPPDSGSVETVFTVASFGTILEVGGGGLTEEEHDSLMAMAINISFCNEIQGGRWKISNNQMIFYKKDNNSEIARFNLYNDKGELAMKDVMERKRV